jgi:hypothetical protein
MKKILYLSLLVCAFSMYQVQAMERPFGKKVTQQKLRMAQIADVSIEFTKVLEDASAAKAILMELSKPVGLVATKTDPLSDGSLLEAKIIETQIEALTVVTACKDLTDASQSDDKHVCDCALKDFYRAAQRARAAAQDIKK